MSTDAKLLLKRAGRAESAERWEHQERGDYNMDRFDREFSERLYSEKGTRNPESARAGCLG